MSIAVQAAAVGLIDVLFRRDGLGGLVPVPFIPGIEVAGRIVGVGEDVEGLVPGQPVVTLSRPGTSGYAEIAVVPASIVLPLDGEGVEPIAPAIAVATLPNVITALAALDSAARLRAEDEVLVLGATGGLASVFPSVAKALGAGKVTGVVTRPGSVEQAVSLGYDEVLLTDQLSSETARFDVVVDPVGGATRVVALGMLRPLGRLVAVGNASDSEQVLVGTNDLWLSSTGVVGLNIAALLEATPERMRPLAARAVELVRSGSVSVPVESLPLEAAGEAHRRLESREASGKIVLTPSAQRPD
ncbi:zinc-binding alcohol dehydrogenase family protein [Leifsonia sp. NPDC058292]|uniref:quinone oxidoreductase family protein n=1 Tax=Leifsonia sp. NPDC058292 TaxID=3346428 RepID=UPI0036DF3539